jgi:hypothetical protein
LAYQVSCLEHHQVDFVLVEHLQIGQADLAVVLEVVGLEATLGQTPLQWHLAAFEAYLVVAAGTGFLAFVASARCLAQARTDAASNATLGMLGASCRLDGVELPVDCPSV